MRLRSLHSDQILDEKRKYERLNVERIDALAILNPESRLNDMPVVGRLIDISEGGLGFEYVVLDNTAEALIHSSCEVSFTRFPALIGIAWSRSAILVYDRLFRTRSFAVLTVRRCGLRWMEPLSKSEMGSLESAVQKANSELEPAHPVRSR
jgi:hypothetical protein